MDSQNKSTFRLDLVLAAVMVAMGLTVAGLSWSQLAARKEMAQATVPNSETPSVPAGKTDGPAESKPGGTRPTTPPPEPARPDADAQKRGATPALPAAPAEKMGEPVQK
jgi:hypothetical protein